MLIYSLGRGLQPYDRRTVDSIVKQVTASDYKFQALLYSVVRSLPFQSRRGEAAVSEGPVKPKETARR
jgi:hypothetical protein